ncbi:glutathione S-transferase [Defluviimonas denitrificans]|jgi:glutathione S-transferase|uniref:Glutathione S-transferase n=1 Tax=Albidovulum denitrificans TaxID=404881 RepID=A0A2S8S429_9RHOB|nr:glutathione S-transferase family protein [Defluviimonas denitrificans]PQV55561.1 glutathione S-transferase [Defluviimonas denitrificans]
MLRLYTSPTTPFGRKAMVLILEAGLADQVEIAQATGSPLDSSKMPLSQNPLGKIPALERGDGPAVYDSRVICRYLDDRAGAGLYPPAPRLWETLTLEATADGMIEAAILMLYEDRLRPEEKRFDGWVEGQWAKIARALDTLEGRWMSHLNGPLDMGQIAIGVALSYLDFRFDARGWREGRPELARWHEAFAARESMVATVPQG